MVDIGSNSIKLLVANRAADGTLQTLSQLVRETRIGTGITGNPPRLGEMLGEDDWFDKIDAHGRDYNRLAYMNRLHAFTEAQKQKILQDA